MTFFDYAVLSVVGFSVLLGCWRGIVSEALALAAWVVAFIAARMWAVPAGQLVSGYVREASLQYATGFVIVFCAVLLAVALARLLLRSMLHAAGLGVLDRFLGACFGIARGVLVAVFFVLVGGLTALPKQDWWRNAMFAPALETIVLASRPWLPEVVTKRIRYR